MRMELMVSLYDSEGPGTYAGRVMDYVSLIERRGFSVRATEYPVLSRAGIREVLAAKPQGDLSFIRLGKTSTDIQMGCVYVNNADRLRDILIDVKSEFASDDIMNDMIRYTSEDPVMQIDVKVSESLKIKRDLKPAFRAGRRASLHLKDVKTHWLFIMAHRKGLTPAVVGEALWPKLVAFAEADPYSWVSESGQMVWLGLTGSLNDYVDGDNSALYEASLKRAPWYQHVMVTGEWPEDA